MTLKRSSTHFYKRTPTILPVLHVLWEHLNSIVGAMSSNYEYKISHNSEAIFQMFHISYFTFSHLNQSKVRQIAVIAHFRRNVPQKLEVKLLYL